MAYREGAKVGMKGGSYEAAARVYVMDIVHIRS
jgi:hypothetical protein